MKILFLASRFPYPLEKGDKLRAYHQLKYLSQHHDVTLYALSDVPVGENDYRQVQKICENIHLRQLGLAGIVWNLVKNVFSPLPFQVAYFFRNGIHQEIDALIRTQKPDVIYCQLVRMAEYGRGNYPAIKVLDYMDVMSKGMERISGRSRWLMKQITGIEYRRVRNYERDIFFLFDAHTIISEQDKQLIPHKNNEHISVIPNGVDLEYYAPVNEKAEYDLSFVGNMSYKPNIESALFIGNELLPLLMKVKPDIKIVIAGASPVQAVRDLACENLIVTGWVDDVRQYLGKSKIHLAPMLINTGLQNKILQAMAMKIPCVVSPMANNAIGAPEGSCVVVADSAKAYVEEILTLLKSESLCHLMAENAFLFVSKYFGWEAHNNSLEKLFASTINTKK